MLRAHALMLPENPGGGANHYPMAAEALEALGFEESIAEHWIEDAPRYGGELGRVHGIEDRTQANEALGSYDRFGDWLDFFRNALRDGPWRPVVAEWAPRLAPALCAAAFHGVIRTGHAVRALRQRDTLPRRMELAAGLAYWAARYEELPTAAPVDGEERALGQVLAELESPWIEDRTDVDFFSVVARMKERPIAPPVRLEETGRSPREDLQDIVREAATGFLEMLVLERNRTWLLHTVTGPAAVEWLLPEVDRHGGRALVEYSRQSVVAMYTAYGEPFTARRHLRSSPGDWTTHIASAVERRSVHGIKLIDALVRFDRDGDPLWRSVAAQWSEWT